MKSRDRKDEIYRVTVVGFLVNLLLTAAKFVAGIVGRSGAMVADGIHSLSDLLTDFVVLICVRLSSKPQDADHEYGHGKYETLATIIIGILLAVVAFGIFYKSIQDIIAIYNGAEPVSPGVIAVIAAGVSIVTKEVLYQYTYRVGKRVNSSAVMANAWHHRSDAFSSIATLFGIGGAYFLGGKWNILDPIAAIIVSALIVKVSYVLILPGVKELLEESLPADVEKKIVEIAMTEREVQNVHDLKTRHIGKSVVIEFHMLLDADMTVAYSHEITSRIEKKLLKEFGDDTLVMIHVEPA